LFAEPISLTVGASTPSLPRTSSADNQGEFRTADGFFRLQISHQYQGTRTRRLIKIQQNKVAADPLLSGRSVPVNAAVHLVVDQPVVGFSAAELKDLVLSLTTLLTASSAAKTVQLVGGES